MASVARLYASHNNGKNDQAEGSFHTTAQIYRLRAKPNMHQARQSDADQVDATHSHNTLTKPRRRRHHGHRFKQHSISTGTLFKHSHSHLAQPIEQPVIYHIPKHARTELNLNHGISHSTMLPVTQKSLSKKDKTFIGHDCAACGEPVEHKSNGEKVLKLSCGHVCHETCLLVCITGESEEDQVCPDEACGEPLNLDSSHGGSVTNLSKSEKLKYYSKLPLTDADTLSKIVKTAVKKTKIPQAPPQASSANFSNTTDNDAESSKHFSKSSSRNSNSSTSSSILPSMSRHTSRGSSHLSTGSSRHTSQGSLKDGKDAQVARIEDLVTTTVHARRQGNTNTNSFHPHESTLELALEPQEEPTMEEVTNEPDPTQNIPGPLVTIRSEFPTITRSAQQQSLTCLVTVEVPHRRTITPEDSSKHNSGALQSSESQQVLDTVAADLFARVDNWHGLEVETFGPLRLHASLKVGRDGTNWQKLDCFLFSELLICVKEKRLTQPALSNGRPACQLKGSILVKQHLRDVESSADGQVLTLNLCVDTLPTFRLKFPGQDQLEIWKNTLVNLDSNSSSLNHTDDESSGNEDDGPRRKRPSSVGSSVYSGAKSTTTAPTDYADQVIAESLHVPIDLVVVIPVSSAIQGLKIKNLKDALRFLVTHLGNNDRMGLVTFGSNGGPIRLTDMATKDWYGWRDVYRSIKPAGQKALRPDAAEGANAALETLLTRENPNPVSSIFLISDSQLVENESVDNVVARAHAHKVSIYSFGLGQAHKPDNLIELSSRTNASYVYVKEWKMLSECVAGCLGSLHSISHTAARLKLKIPIGSVAKFVKVSGALHTMKRSAGRDAEAVLGDLRFGDKRDVLIQLSIDPDAALSGEAPQDQWDTLVSGLTALGATDDEKASRHQSLEEVPLIQADLSYGDFARDGAISHLSQPSLLSITMLPPARKLKRASMASIVPPIPSHPSIVQRRMEMLTSDMLTRALTLVSKGQHDSAHRLLAETRTILQGLGKGNLPPLPPGPPARSGHSRSSSKVGRSASPRGIGAGAAKDGRASPRIPLTSSGRASPNVMNSNRSSNNSLPSDMNNVAVPRAGSNIDAQIMRGLDADIEACLQFIDHPAVFSHDAKKTTLQNIGVINAQRGYTFRTETESFWASRIYGVKKMTDAIKDWQSVGSDILAEEY